MTSESQDSPALHKPAWGLFPEDVLSAVKNKHWQNPSKLKHLLKGDCVFPLKLPLKPPRGNAALENMNHFQEFISAWRAFSQGLERHGGEARSQHQGACDICWERRSFRSLSVQEIPTHLIIPDIRALACLLGKNEVRQLTAWQSKIAYVLDALASSSVVNGRPLFLSLIDHLETLDTFDDSELELLVKLMPQLQQGMGAGCYLRALPVTFVDTKFIEKNLRIIESITAAHIDESVRELGLLPWLHCKEKPKDWLLVKPLCQQTTASLGGVPLLRLSSDTLLDFVLPARNILVIENEQSCLALSNIPHTIAVSGGGKNIAWMKAEWLAAKNVGYWGDIDSEGLSILSDVRSKLSSITPLMMDALTVESYQERMVDEPDSVSKEPIALTQDELALFKHLRSERYAHTRLEQERLPMDYVMKAITSWRCDC